MISAMPRDTTTKHQGVFARNKKDCGLEAGGERCNCQPPYLTASKYEDQVMYR
jgi:hypothetical protein